MSKYFHFFRKAILDDPFSECLLLLGGHAAPMVLLFTWHQNKFSNYVCKTNKKSGYHRDAGKKVHYYRFWYSNWQENVKETHALSVECMIFYPYWNMAWRKITSLFFVSLYNHPNLIFSMSSICLTSTINILTHIKRRETQKCSSEENHNFKSRNFRTILLHLNVTRKYCW